jgi:pimeloyl-ACP methyl ester carboxylesterase
MIGSFCGFELACTPMSTLIFLPGLAADADLWADQTRALPHDLRWAISLVHFRHPSIRAMAAAVLREHRGPLALCGTSMGGMIALEALRQAPERITGLALLGSNARPETEVMRGLRSAAVGKFRAGQLREVIEPNIALAFHAAGAARPDLRARYWRFIQSAGGEALARQNEAVMERPDARAHLSRIECPTLVACGVNDLLTPPECSQEMAQAIGHAKLALIPRCGHMLTMERAPQVNALLKDWIARWHRP